MNDRGSRSRWTVAAVMLGAIVAFYVLREHWDHAVGLAPYALLLLCPLMHLFHGGHGNHGSHGSHGSHSNSDQERPADPGRPR